MHYTQYWQITHSPFLAANAKRLYRGGTIEEALARVRFLIKNQSSFGLLIGPSLVGKTLLLKHLAQHLTWNGTSNRPRVAYISLLDLDMDSMLSCLTEKLSLSETYLQNSLALSRERRWSLFEDAMRGVISTNKHIVLLVDDTHLGAEEIYMILRRMANASVPTTCICSITNDRIMDLPRGLIDRCQLRIHLQEWDLGQTADYFEYSLDQCKGRDSMFDAQSITRIHELSEGLPYRINYLSDLCLVAGALRRSNHISADIVEDVASELSMHGNHSDYEMASFDPSEPTKEFDCP